MKSYQNSGYKNNIHISINGVRLDETYIKLAPYRTKNGSKNTASLGIGHNIKANLNDNILYVIISPKIVVHLFYEGILNQDKKSVYDIEIFDWKAKCAIHDIIYGDVHNSHDESILILFNVMEELTIKQRNKFLEL